MGSGDQAEVRTNWSGTNELPKHIDFLSRVKKTKASRTKAANEAFSEKNFELLKCTVLASYGKQLLVQKLRFDILDIAQ